VKSFYYGLNSNSGVFNLISKNFKSLKPYTKIRYSESAYEETFFDGMFSQNFLSNMNFNGGVQRVSADGCTQILHTMPGTHGQNYDTISPIN